MDSDISFQILVLLNTPLGSVYVNINFPFIKREGNCVAHQLAKFTIHLIHEIVWKDSFPDWLNSLARRDIGASATDM